MEMNNATHVLSVTSKQVPHNISTLVIICEYSIK